MIKNNLKLVPNSVIIKEGLHNEEVLNLIRKAKILIQPSYIEGQGIVILEALASKVPVLAYDLPAYQGALLNGKNCELTEVGNLKQFCDGAVKIVKNYEFYRKNCETIKDSLNLTKEVGELKEIVESGRLF